jgi:hypothetical protein
VLNRLSRVVAACSGLCLLLLVASSGAAPEAQTESYSVRLSPKPGYKAGQAGTIEIVIVPKSGYKMNEKYPTKFTADEAPAGLVFRNKVVKPAEGAFTNNRGVLKLQIVPSKSGAVKVGGNAAFSVCSHSACIVGKQHLDVVVHVR